MPETHRWFYFIAQPECAKQMTPLPAPKKCDHFGT